MAIQTKNLTSYAQQDPGPVFDSPTRYQGPGNAASDAVGKLIDAIKGPEEDVHLLIGEGLRRMQEEKVRYEAIVSDQIEADPDAEEKQFRDYAKNLDAIRQKMMGMAKTKRGSLEVSHRLEAWRTNVHGQGLASYLERRNRHISDNAQRELDQLGLSMQSARTMPEVDSIIEQVDKVAADFASDMKYDDDHAEALKEEARKKAITALFNSLSGDGDYQTAKALEEQLAVEYSDIFGKTAVVQRGGQRKSTIGDGATPDEAFGDADGSEGYAGSSVFADGIHRVVEGLRQNQSAREIIQRARASGIGPNSIVAIMAGSPDSAQYQRLKKEADRNNVTMDALYAAATQNQSNFYRQQEIRTWNFWANGLKVFNDQFNSGKLDWNSGPCQDENGRTFESPKAMYQHMLERGRAGDHYAAEMADRFRRLWPLERPEREGGRGSDMWAWGEYLKWREKMRLTSSFMGDTEINHVREMIRQGVFPPESMSNFSSFLTEQNNRTNQVQKVDQNRARSIAEARLLELMDTLPADEVVKLTGVQNPTAEDFLNSPYAKGVMRRASARAGASGGQMNSAEFSSEVGAGITRTISELNQQRADENSGFFTRFFGIGEREAIPDVVSDRDASMLNWLADPASHFDDRGRVVTQEFFLGRFRDHFQNNVPRQFDELARVTHAKVLEDRISKDEFRNASDKVRAAKKEYDRTKNVLKEDGGYDAAAMEKYGRPYDELSPEQRMAIIDGE
ncbi:MAG: hypothetical protein MJ058_04100 [Akkermansia sp.]|nr:hypothetical protein [Akkermansia sp.]